MTSGRIPGWASRHWPRRQPLDTLDSEARADALWWCVRCLAGATVAGGLSGHIGAAVLLAIVIMVFFVWVEVPMEDEVEPEMSP